MGEERGQEKCEAVFRPAARPKITGHFFPPGSAKFSDAMLEASQEGKALRVTGADGALLAEAPRRAVQATSRLGALHRRLDFPGGACFATPDNDAIDV